MGEAVLGETEARARSETYLKALAHPHIDYICVKISTIFSQIEPLALYDNKLDVDPNYRRMVAYGLRPDNIRGARIGIASHHLFELAFAYELAKSEGVEDFLSFEMLKGMADHVRRAIMK